MGGAPAAQKLKTKGKLHSRLVTDEEMVEYRTGREERIKVTVKTLEDLMERQELVLWRG
jgi:hypothetical protein